MMRLLFSAAAGVFIFSWDAFAADCSFNDAGKPFFIEGTVLYVDASNEVVAEMGYGKIVAINDLKRSCTAYVQTKSVSKCTKGKLATAKGTTFVIPFTPVVLAGAGSVKCR